MAELSPAEAAVLLAVNAGASREDEIARLLNTDKETVKRLVEKLVSKGFLRVEERGRLFLRRRRILLTEKGLDALPEARRMLLQEAEKRITSPSGEPREPREPPIRQQEPEPPLLPMLLGLGLLGATLAAAAQLLDETSLDLEEHETHGGEGKNIIEFDPEEWA